MGHLDNLLLTCSHMPNTLKTRNPCWLVSTESQDPGWGYMQYSSLYSLWMDAFSRSLPVTKVPVYSLVPNWLITMPVHSRRGGLLSVRSCNIHLLFFDAHKGPVSTIRQILLESDRCYPIYVSSPNSPSSPSSLAHTSSLH